MARRRSARPTDTCWVDLFEDRQLRRLLRRLHGPGAFPNLRGAGAGFGLSIAGLRAGDSAYVMIFHHAAPDQPLGWLFPGESLPELSEIAASADSLLIYDQPPHPNDAGYASFSVHTQAHRSRRMAKSLLNSRRNLPARKDARRR